MSTIKSTYIQKVGVGTDAFELPANDGTSGQYLQTNGSGALSWQTVASLSNAEDGTGTDFEFNSGFGSNGVAYGVRAWVNFNGTGTIAIRGSGNISSITDGGTGQYRVNFTTDMPDTNYAAVAAANASATSSDPNTYNLNLYDFGTDSFVITTYNDSGGFRDYANISITVIR